MTLRFADRRSTIEDDIDLLNASRRLHEEVKKQYPAVLHTEVAKVNSNFYITPRLEIAVPSLRVLRSRGIEAEEDVVSVIEGGLIHEDAHAYLFPFMTRMNLTYAIVYGYAKTRGFEWNRQLFNIVENVVSDVFNELILYRLNLGRARRKLPFLRSRYVKAPEDADELAQLGVYDPIGGLLRAHNAVFSGIDRGDLREPVVEKPEFIHEQLYNVLSEVAGLLSVEDHVVGLNTGMFTSIVSPLITSYDVYEAADRLYEAIKASGGKPVDIASVLKGGRELEGNAKVYWTYYAVLSALYRYAVENIAEALQRLADETVDQPLRPEAPPPDGLEKILNALRSEAALLDPETIDYVARLLLSSALMTAREGPVEYEETTVHVKLPWYRRPRGRLDPKSLVHESPLEWKVVAKARVPGAAKATRTISVPDTVTIVIDESGSTSVFTSVLAPLVGVDTSVFDVERATAMSLLYNVMRYSEETAVNLVRFSTSVHVEKGTVREMYERLKRITSSELEWMGTNIVEAVEAAASIHRDSRVNYFVLITDMAIGEDDERRLHTLFTEKLKLSPLLIVSISEKQPEILSDLNRYSNVAVVNVATHRDYPKLEKAIAKLASAMIT
ncbi:MAG: hypothetical protein QXQ91_01195 [Nanopusillaceae archaeon]